jgi:hypothetical protein
MALSGPAPNLFYFDPSSGLVEPIISDMLGHGTQLFPLYKYRIWKDFVPFPKVTLNERMQPLMNVVLSDPTFADLRNQKLYEALTTFGSAQQQISDLSDLYKKIDPDVAADPFKTAMQNAFVGTIPIPYSNAQFIDAQQTLFEWIKRRETYLLGELEKTQVKISAKADELNNVVTLLFEVSGNSAIHIDPAKINGELYADKDLDGSTSHRISKPMRLYPGLKEYIGTDWDLWTYGDKRHLVPGVQRYLFSVKSTSLKQLKSDLGNALQNAITRSPVTPGFTSSSDIATENYVISEASLHAWRLEHEVETPVILGPGIVDLRTDLQIGKKQMLTIRAGTRVRMAKGVSIISEGKTLIEGTSEKPVLFERLIGNEAWGGVALQGREASGSIIRHAEFKGGTTIKHANVFYSGMVSVHHAERVAIENSTFSKNTISDDTLHIVNSDVSLSKIQFSDCYSDCIDLDYSSSDMSDIQIDRAGNDGIDFMGTRAVLSQIKINGANDKGLSVGEKSDVHVSSASIERATIGLAVKDASTLNVDKIDLMQSEIAIDVFVKHKIYGAPGSITASEATFSQNEVNIRSQEGGVILFKGQNVPDKISGDGRIESIN